MWIAYPHLWFDPPEKESSFSTLDIFPNHGWPKTEILGDPYLPKKSLGDFILKNLLPSTFIPGSEEATLFSGLANDYFQQPGLSLSSAIACMYRLKQRTILDNLGVAPNFVSYEEFLLDPFPPPFVLKAPVSTLGLGVAVVKTADSLDKKETLARQRTYIYEDMLKSVIKEPLSSLIEEYISGDQIEISGIIDLNGDIVHWFNALKQKWGEGRIYQYEPIKFREIEPQLAIVEKVVKAFDLKACGFCIEMRGEKVIEVHPRLGEDYGDYQFFLSPAQRISNYFVDIFNV